MRTKMRRNMQKVEMLDRRRVADGGSLGMSLISPKILKLKIK